MITQSFDSLCITVVPKWLLLLYCTKFQIRNFFTFKFRAFQHYFQSNGSNTLVRFRTLTIIKGPTFFEEYSVIGIGVAWGRGRFLFSPKNSLPCATDCWNFSIMAMDSEHSSITSLRNKLSYEAHNCLKFANSGPFEHSRQLCREINLKVNTSELAFQCYSL